MPRRRAYSFIICANAASVPPTFSASAMLASFPGLYDHALDENVHRDLRTDLHETARTPGTPGVLADGGHVGELQPAFRERLKTTYAVMSLVRLAGSARSSA